MEINKDGKREDIYEYYEKQSYAVIALDGGYNIIYKNSAAARLGIKPRIGTGIKKYVDFVNLEKLYGAAEKGEYRILRLDADSPVRRCVIQPESKDMTVLAFYYALNFLKENDAGETEIIRKVEDIIGKYNERRKTLRTGRDNGGFFPENNKKAAWINEHFRKHMINIYSDGDDKHNTYCDIGAFFNRFAASISQYMSSFGYKVSSHIEDKMFFCRLDESDLLLINFIMSAFAFSHSIFNKVEISFNSDYYSGVARYRFTAGSDFLRERKDIFGNDYLSEIIDIEYLDLNLAAIIAQNNGLKLRVWSDGDDGSSVFLDLIFDIKIPENLKSPLLDESPNYITSDNIKEQAEIEFAVIFEEDI